MPAPTRMETLRQMLQKEPNDGFCLYGIAQEFAKADQLEEAVVWFEKVLAVEPLHGYAAFHMAKALDRLGRTPQAIAMLHQGIHAASQSGDTKALNELRGFLDELTP